MVPGGQCRPARPHMHPKKQTGEGRQVRPGGADDADLQPTVCGCDQEGFQENKKE